MKKGQNRKEFLQNLGAISLAAGAGSIFPIASPGQPHQSES